MSSNLNMTRALQSCLLLGVAMSSGGCKSNTQASGVQEQHGAFDPVCNLLVPMLMSLPIPNHNSIGQFVGAAAEAVSRTKMRQCEPTPKATLGQETLDEIAAIIGFEVEQALDDNTIKDMGGLVHHMGNYTHGSATAASELATMHSEASTFLTKFRDSDKPLLFLVNYLSAATLELNVLEEILLNDLEAGMIAKEKGKDTTRLLAAVREDAKAVRQATLDYEAYGDRLRKELVPSTAVGFFNADKDTKITLGMYYHVEQVYDVNYHQARAAKPLSGPESSHVRNLAAAGKDTPFILSLRQGLIDHPVTLDKVIKNSTTKLAADNADKLKADGEFTEVFNKKVTEVQAALDAALFQTEEMNTFVKKIRESRANAELNLTQVDDGSVFAKPAK